MEDWIEAQEVMRADIIQLKDQIGQISRLWQPQRALGKPLWQDMKKRLLPTLRLHTQGCYRYRTIILKGTRYLVSPYGLPLAYILTFEEYSEQNRVPLTIPVSIPILYANQRESLQMPIDTHAAGGNAFEATTFTRPQMTSQPRVLYEMAEEGS